MSRLKLSCTVALVAACVVPAAAQTPQSFDPPVAGSGLDHYLPQDGSFAPQDDRVLSPGGLAEEGFGDGRRTLGAFPKNLGRGFVSVFSRESVRPFLVGALAAGAGSFADTRTNTMFSGRAPGFGKVGSTAGGIVGMAPLTVGLFVAGRASRDTKFRAATYDLAEATIVTGVYTSVLKAAVHRPRPDGSNNLSFPSGHTSSAFAMASVAEAHYGPKVGVPAFALASAIGLSRIESNKHNLSDVLAGATLGYIVGHSVVHSNGEPVGRQKRFTLTPATDANGGGMGAGVSVSW